MILCPDCHSAKIKKNGHTHYGKQNYKCKDCSRQFVHGSTHLISEQTKRLIRRALVERISLRGICRVFNVSLSWMLSFAVREWSKAPDDLAAQLPFEKEGAPIRKLQIIGFQIDEMWSFVQKKQDKAWIWVLYYPGNRQVVQYYIGRRDKYAFQALWNQIPADWKRYCDFETDQWAAFKTAIDPNQHYDTKALTYWIESFFGRVRARVARLTRQSRSFSKSAKNHQAAIKYFFWKSNLEMAALHL